MFAESNSQSSDSKKSLLVEFVNTLEWLVTAFMLAFIFRAFVMEAFRIPTGSMANTLRGAHFRMQCPGCGYQYDYGFIPENYGLRSEVVPPGLVPITPHDRPNLQTKCPSCGFFIPGSERREVYNGDRILVLKCIYQLFEPQRWDVVVFKNPLEPKINYIKRLIAGPGETVEIIDGNIFIDGKIARKPLRVQNELWSVIYNNDYQPINPQVPRFNGRQWRQPFENVGDSRWQVDKLRPTVFVLDVSPEETSVMRYNTAQGNDLAAVCSYNAVGFATAAEQSSDLKIRFHVEHGPVGTIGATLSKYESVYKGLVDFSGRMTITRKAADKPEVELASASLRRPGESGFRRFSFVNVDHKLKLQFGDEQLEVYMASDPNGMGIIPEVVGPSSVTVFGSGRLSLSRLALFRDIHYVSIGHRGQRGMPFTLKDDEFFVLGDNSPNSQDSRWWTAEGIGNAQKTYRAGIVPRDYLVGKAVLVYWPSGFTILDWLPIFVTPDFGRLRLIYGGSDRLF
ncbi:MAG TPA: signal peptidase I [Sedimentisphaerales bacterium]|nr:signal peptidase I [Sedimentisphaerales bacterium]